MGHETIASETVLALLRIADSLEGIANSLKVVPDSVEQANALGFEYAEGLAAINETLKCVVSSIDDGPSGHSVAQVAEGVISVADHLYAARKKFVDR